MNIIYCRTASWYNLDSIKTQLNRCLDYAKQANIEIDKIIVEETSSVYEQDQTLVNEIISNLGAIEKIIITDLSKIHNNPQVAADFAKQLTGYHIALYCLDNLC